MSHSIRSEVVFVTLIWLWVLPLSPALAQFTGAGTQATSWVVEFLTPIIPLGCVVMAAFAFAGRINWGWFGGACIGTALFFGRDQVVSMFRGWMGV